MKKAILILIFLTFPLMSEARQTWSSAPVPNVKDFGLGLELGTIVSITGKYWLSERGAMDFGLGLVGSPWTVMYADYLWHIPRAFGSSSQFGRESSLYLGGGGGLGFWSGTSCGHWNCDWRSRSSGTGLFIRGVAGVEWYPSRSRFGVFGELGPSMMLVPGTWGTLDIGVGGRYYF